MIITKKAAVLAALGLLASAALAQPADDAARSGRYLAANCANCHGTTGNAQGAMPSLAGQQKGYIVDQMNAFRDGKRPATIMHQLSKGYTDQQIELIADHFSRQKPAR
jgi:cytochrome c553